MLTRLLGPAGAVRTLALAQLITALGNGLFLTCFVLYITRIVGLSPTQLGLGLSAAAVVGMFAGVPFGHLADQWGPRGVTALLYCGTAVMTVVLLFVGTFPVFVLAVCVYMLVTRGGNAAKQALTAGVLDGAALVSARARVHAVNNFGMSVGAAMGALVLQIDTPAAYLTALSFDALTFLGCALIFLRLPRVARAPRRSAGEPRLAVLRDRPYTVVAVVNAVMLAHAPLLEVILPLWLVLHTDAPHGLVAGLVLLNTVAVVLFQVRIGERIDTLRRAVRAFRLAGLVLAAACLAYASSSWGGVWPAVLLLLVATLLQVWGEMVHSAGSWVVAYELAPAGQQGQYQGLFNTGLSVAQTAGPAVLTLLLIDGGGAGWLVLAAVFATVGLAMEPAARWAARTRPASDTTPAGSATAHPPEKSSPEAAQ